LAKVAGGKSREEPAGKEKAEPAATTAEQLQKALALDGQGPEDRGRVTLTSHEGRKRVYRPAKQQSAKSLQQRVGDPDGVEKFTPPRFPKDPPAAGQQPRWTIWSWGNIEVLVDDKGTTRYFRTVEQ
jgi:hypothetical protein